MALSDCPKCWETPCNCGHEYKDWSVEALKKQINMLQEILMVKEYKEYLKIKDTGHQK